MPLYDFHCPSCDRIFELLVRCDADPLCPLCSGPLNRLLGAPALSGASTKLLRQARAQASREGHFSHYSASERSRIKT